MNVIDKALRRILSPQKRCSLASSLVNERIEFRFTKRRWLGVVRKRRDASCILLLNYSEIFIFRWNDTGEFLRRITFYI